MPTPDFVRERIANTGAGNLVLDGGAETLDKTFADAGFAAGDRMRCVIIDNRNRAREVGDFTMLGDGTLERTRLIEQTINGVHNYEPTEPIFLSNRAIVYHTITADLILEDVEASKAVVVGLRQDIEGEKQVAADSVLEINAAQTNASRAVDDIAILKDDATALVGDLNSALAGVPVLVQRMNDFGNSLDQLVERFNILNGEIPELDHTPDAIVFNNVTSAQVSTTVVSNEITVTGIDDGASFLIDNGTAIIDGVNAGDNGTVNNGQTFQLETVTGPDFGITRTIAWAIGTVSGDWAVETRAAASMTNSSLGASAVYVGATTADAVVNDSESLQAAIDSLAGAGGTIGIAEGAVLREEITATGFTASNPLRIVGMGTSRPTITGAEPLTGFAQCTSADQAVTGAGFANFYKATIPLPANIDPHELNIHENGNQLSIANDRGAPEKAPSQFITPIETWHTAQSVNGASGEPLTGYTDPRFATYAPSELLNALIYGTHESNRTRLFTITSVNGNDIAVDNSDGVIVENNGNEAKYALINVISAATAGQWGYVIDGANVTVYLRPTNDIAPGDIEYTARERVIDTDDMQNMTFEGLNLVQGREIVSRSSSNGIAREDRKENIHFHECVLGNISCRISEGIVAIDGVNNTSFTKVTMQNVLGGRAFSLGQMNKWVVDNIHINYVERQPISMFGGQGGGANPPTDNTVEPARGWSQYCLVQNFLCENSAYETHSNAANFYLGCNWVVLQHGTFRNCPAYVTPQDCSNMLCHAVDFGYNTGGNGRVFEDQTRNSTTDAILHLPNGGGLLNIVNCLALPDPARLDDTGLIQIGRPGASNTVNIVNTIAGGGGITADTNPDKFGDSIGNVFIGGAQTVTPADRVVNAASDIFIDPAAGDFSYVEDSILGVSGVDPTPYLQPFVDAFAAVGIDLGPIRYGDGTALDTADVSVGPVPIDFEYVPPPFTPGQIVGFPAGAYLHTETLTPTPETKKLTMAFRVYHVGDWEAGGRLFYMEDENSRELITFAHSHSNRLFITFRDDTNTSVASWGFPSNSAFNVTDTYQYHLISIDTEAGSAQHFINDQEITYNGLSVVQDGLIAGDLVAAFLNASSNSGFGSTQGRRFSDLSVSFTEAIDFSAVANRRKFHNAAGVPVSIGAEGRLAYQAVPHIYLSNDAENYHLNRGTGGNFLRGGPDLVDVPGAGS